jgi:nitrate/TMAO reductase-like tetraheme cytochrome c subunit
MSDGAAAPAEPAPPRRRRWRGKVLVFTAVGAVLLGGAAFAGLWELSSSPRLCASCHIMTPYVAAWRASKHREVACVQCHYPPGLRDTIWVKYQALSQVAKWATRTYSSKPFAEVEDGSCLRSGCHDVGLVRRELIYKRGIVFDHAPHLRATLGGHQLRCTSCHSQVVVDTHIQVTTSTCFLCHFKGTRTARSITPVAGCTGCHRTPIGDIVLGTVRFSHQDVVKRGVRCESCHLSVVEGDGEAPRDRCLTCHNEPAKLQRYPDTELVHRAHVAGHNIECTRCHSEIRHRLPPRIGVPTAAGA